MAIDHNIEYLWATRTIVSIAVTCSHDVAVLRGHENEKFVSVLCGHESFKHCCLKIRDLSP